MKKEYFDNIINNLQQRVDLAKKYVSPLNSKDDILNLTVKDLQTTVGVCRTLQSDMDKIYIDLHHIFGMGNLTVIQTSKLIKLMNEFVSYRSDIKALVQIDNLNLIPKLPTTSSYTLQVLDSITLINTRGIGSSIEEDSEDSVNSNYYKFTKDEIGNINIEIVNSNKAIHKFGSMLFKLNGATYNKNSFTKKVKNGKEVFGINFLPKVDEKELIVSWVTNISPDVSTYDAFNKLFEK